MHRFNGKQATAIHPHSTEPHRDADCPEATGRRADRCGVAVASVSLRPGRNRVRIPAMKKGDLVQTPLGRGIVREVRNRGRVLVEVRGRATEVPGSQITLADRAGRRAGRRRAQPETVPATAGRAASASVEVDLHGFTVPEALARVDAALSDALLADAVALRLIHGRSGGRIRVALHAHLRALGCRFRLDPTNPGVTLVVL